LLRPNQHRLYPRHWAAGESRGASTRRPLTNYHQSKGSGQRSGRGKRGR
jgi:hypothetical protein